MESHGKLISNIFKLISLSEGGHVNKTKQNKTKTQKFQLHSIGRKEERVPMPFNGSPLGRKRLLFFPGKNSTNDGFWALYHSPPKLFFFFFPSLVACFFPHSGRTCMWLLWLHNVNCNSLLIPNKPIFAGKIFGSLFSKSIIIITKLISLSGFLFPLSLRTLISLSICSCTSVCV